MRQFILILCILSLMAHANEKKSLPLSDNKVDKIFLSFVKERELQVEEKRKKAEEDARKAKYGLNNIPENPNSVVEGTNSYKDLNQPIVDLGITNSEAIVIKGIFCEERSCVFFTKDKKYAVGDFISPAEKVLQIKRNYIKTNFRKIKY